MKTYEIEFKLNDGSLIKINANNAKNRQTITIKSGHWWQPESEHTREVIDCRDAARLNKIAKQLACKTYTQKFWTTMLLNMAADILAI